MNKIPKTVWVILGLIGVGAAATTALAEMYPSGTWRYKMTVTVETPEGIKTGSAVREVHAYIFPNPLSTTNGNTSLTKGEAVVVDLGKRGVLFALMCGEMSGQDYGWMIVYNAFPIPGSNGETTEEIIRHYSSLKNAKVTLKPEQYPMFVRFRDINDPKTVDTAVRDVIKCPDDRKECNGRTGYLALNTMEKSFGTGVAIKEVTIEMTDEPVTENIKKYMPSYEPQSEYMKWFNSLPYGDSRKIGPYDFKAGESKGSE